MNARIESEGAMARETMGGASVQQGELMQMPMQEQAARQGAAPANASDAVIGAGNYTFGANFPIGVFDLQVVSGEGSFCIYNVNGENTYNWMGGDQGAMSWSGLSSEGNKSFMLGGSLRVRVTRARMIQV